MQAAVLRVFLPHLTFWNDQRRTLASSYIEQVARIEGVKVVAATHPHLSVWHHFVLRVPERGRFREQLLRDGIETRVHYPQAVTDIEPIRKRLGAASLAWNFPCAKSLADECVSLPMHPWLGPDARACTEALGRYAEMTYEGHP